MQERGVINPDSLESEKEKEETYRNIKSVMVLCYPTEMDHLLATHYSNEGKDILEKFRLNRCDRPQWTTSFIWFAQEHLAGIAMC